MPGDKYNHLIERIDLKSIEMASLQCSRNSELKIEAKKNTRISLKHGIEDVKIEGSEFYIQVEFKLKAYIPTDMEQVEVTEISTENILFTIVFQMDLKYNIDLDSEKKFIEEYKEELELFVENNALINVWPYARETISSLTTRMGFTSLSIPSYKYMPKY